MEYYEVEFIEMDGNEVTRDFRHFTDEDEAKQMFNDLKDNPEIVRVTRNELFKGDGKNYLGGSEERESAVNKETDLHRIFLNSRLGDKRFIEEPIMGYFGKRNQARKEFLQSESVSMEEADLTKGEEKKLKGMSKSLKKSSKGHAGQAKYLDKLVKEEESTSIEKIYMDMLKNELPSQDEVNDAFEKFEREAHYLNNKPVGEWDAMDMSNWKSILRKGGRVMESMARYILHYTTKDGKEKSIDFISGLNAEDEFYELQDDDNVISAKIENIYYDPKGVQAEFTRDENGKAIVKLY